MKATSFRSFTSGQRMLAVEEAQQAVIHEVEPLASESIELSEALGRVLREDIVASYDVPQADNTAMDGYAVCAADLIDASDEQPVTLEVIEDLPAGKVPASVVISGTAVRIMTGALMPQGADAVAPVEITDGGRSQVRVLRAVKAGANIRRRGEDMKKGNVVLRDGTLIRAAQIGVLASMQRAVVHAGKRPTVAIISTGDEIVGIDEPLGPGKVVNSNSWSLVSLCREAGATPRTVGIVRDSSEATVRAIESALDCDFIITSGGVSVGAYDFVKDALEELGAETRFWQVAMKPGKPVVLSRVRGRLFFGLPGNPVSCMVSFHLFIAPALRKAMGQRDGLFSPVVRTRLDTLLRSKGDRRAYQRVRVLSRDGELVSVPMRSQGSGVSTSMVGANGLAILEAGVTEVEAGSLVPTVLFGVVESE